MADSSDPIVRSAGATAASGDEVATDEWPAKHERPLLTQDIMIFDEGEGTVRLRRPTRKWDYTLNVTAAYILSLCDGNRTVEEIANALAQNFNLGDDEARKNVGTVVVALRRLKVLDHD